MLYVQEKQREGREQLAGTPCRAVCSGWSLLPWEDSQGWTWRAAGRFPKARAGVMEGWDAGGAEHGTSALPCWGAGAQPCQKLKPFALK